MSDTNRDKTDKTAWKTFTEEVEVASNQLIAEINKLITEGNVRRLEVRSEKGDVFLAIPLTGAAVAGGVLTLAVPWLAILAAVAGLVAKVRLAIVREEAPEEKMPPVPPVPPSAADHPPAL